VTLSGIDGSGKSTTALELAAGLEADGHVPWVSWSRLAADKNLLDLIALPIRRVMRRRDSIADPVAAGDLTATNAVRPVRSGWDPVAWAWVLVVSWLTVRNWRRVSRLRRRGLVVICDRWLIDALVDLEARYGRRGTAIWLLRHGVPRADLEILLEIDADTSTRRKPGDQAPRVLEVMARRYAEAAGELGFPPAGAPARDGRVTLDARGDWSQVLHAVQQHLAPRLG
jgi:thymidylate kinase